MKPRFLTRATPNNPISWQQGACLAKRAGPFCFFPGPVRARDPYKRKSNMQKLKELFYKYYEQISYLFFGGLATLLSFALLVLFQALGGKAFAVGIGNVFNNAICILFAYWTNRTFVFKSKNKGKAALSEFTQFVSCRILTAVLDQLIMWLGGTVLGITLLLAGQDCGPLLVKLFSQVVVIVSNYVFSKLFIFKEKTK